MEGIRDWKDLLNRNPTDWLLGEDDPGVRYLALRDIVDAGGKELASARVRAHREGPIAVILDNMNPEGWWVQPGTGYLPKFRSSVWSVMSLAQLGGSVEADDRISVACKYLLDHSLARGGQFYIRKNTDIGLCLQGNMLESLTDLGCHEPGLDIAFEWMARRITGDDLSRKINDDGLSPADGVNGPFRTVRFITDPLFGCRTNDGMSCAWAGSRVMAAFSRLHTERRTELINRAMETGIRYFLNADIAAVGFPGHRKGDPDPRWWQFGFPWFGTDILGVAETMTALGFGGNIALAKTLRLIYDKQDDSGKWKYDYPFKNNKMWVSYGTPGQPNKWVTLRAVRVLKRAVEQGYVPA